ncbi:BbrUII/HgiDII family restriction enzyme [Streptomyces sp. enrichment culture]|uniref:BbrUII/HgiDII family restriction enzyme n=1 Tax=Streptomyces sp. enrichment culture TaxID=1795815 RepID=UPI003F562406
MSTSTSSSSPYVMTLDLNVLNHLGINLYSNIPAVLSEIVANAYDADATRVDITIDQKSGRVVIQDNGSGMSLQDVNGRFLSVGYRRREQPNGAITPKHHRPVMGRKGIGKLSLFSIARVINVDTVKEETGERNALVMRLADIEQAMTRNGDDSYRPEPQPTDHIDFAHGTRIILSDLKKSLGNTPGALRKRLARRFSALGASNDFRLFINGTEVTIADRDYFHKIQYLWTFGNEEAGEQTAAQCKKLEHHVHLPSATEYGTISGWIGTVSNSRDLKESGGENLNQITLMTRGKLAHEDILDELRETSVYRSYMIGELTADFLDDDDKEDIATSSRQKIIEDDPRYEALIEWLQNETLPAIRRSWTDLRNQDGTKSALMEPLVAEWFETLGSDTKKKARRLFGKINQVAVNNEAERKNLLAHMILAFETMRYKDNLDALDQIGVSDLGAIAKIFGDVVEIESVLYHQIVTQRLRVIEKLQGHMSEDALEKVLQKHLYDNMWLLDPSWERATEPTMEERVDKAFQEITQSLDDDVKARRMDIRYRRVTGAHVIVELKRYSVKVSSTQLIEQISRYRDALESYLEQTGQREPVEVVCVVGEDLADWKTARNKERSIETLAAQGARVVKYDELLNNAENGYKQYLRKRQDVGRIRTILDSLAATANDESAE